jgi:hypothetical protein
MTDQKPKKLKNLRPGSLTDRLLGLLRESEGEGLGPHELAEKLGTSVPMVRDITLHLRRKGLVVKAPVIYRLTQSGATALGILLKERRQLVEPNNTQRTWPGEGRSPVVRYKSHPDEPRTVSRLNIHALSEVDMGDDSAFIKDLDVLVEGGWKDLRQAFEDKDVVTCNLNRELYYSTPEDQARGWHE